MVLVATAVSKSRGTLCAPLHEEQNNKLHPAIDLHACVRFILDTAATACSLAGGARTH